MLKIFLAITRTRVAAVKTEFLSIFSIRKLIAASLENGNLLLWRGGASALMHFTSHFIAAATSAENGPQNTTAETWGVPTLVTRRYERSLEHDYIQVLKLL